VATIPAAGELVAVEGLHTLAGGPARCGTDRRSRPVLGFATTFLRPGGFAGNARQWVRPILGDGVVRLPYPESGDSAIDERDIADTPAPVLLAGPGGPHDGTAPTLKGPESPARRQEVQILADALGREVRIDPVSHDEARAFMTATMPPFVTDSLLEYWAAADGRPDQITDAVESVTGRPARTFATWAREIAVPLTVG